MSRPSSSKCVTNEWRSVCGPALRDARVPDGVLDGALQDGFVQMMSAPLAGEPLHVHAGRREDPVPHPLSPRIRVFPSERRRKLDPPGSALHVTAILLPHGLQMTSEIRLDHGGEHPHPVLLAPAAPPHELVRREDELLAPPAARPPPAPPPPRPPCR